VGNTVIVDIYLLIDYRDGSYATKFLLACRILGKCLHFHLVLLKDLQCDSWKRVNLRTALLLSLIPNKRTLLYKSADFAYTHPSESVSNIDCVLVFSSITSSPVSKTIFTDFEESDHLLLSFSIATPFNRIRLMYSSTSIALIIFSQR